MSRRDLPADGPPQGDDGSWTAVDGTPLAVDVSRDRGARTAVAMFLAGPVIWSVHFLVVYLVVDAACAGRGPGGRPFDPPMPAVVTLVATVVAALACVASAVWGYRRWRTARQEQAGDAGGPGEPGRGGSLAFAGFLLSLLGLVTVLFVGLPALALPAC